MDFGPILQNRFSEYYVPAVNQEIFSLAGSDSFYRRHFEKALQQEDSLYLIVGTDSGRLVHWVIRCGLAEGSRYLFIEYPALVETLRQDADFPLDLPENMRICTPDDWLAQAEELSLKDYCYLGSVRRIKSLAVVDAFFDGYLDLWNKFEETIGQYQMMVGQEMGARVFMVKGLENLAENRVSAHFLMDLFKGKTAILLAGGPSLKESYGWVKANRDNLVVLAVSRIALQLKREGIIPDCFFAIDPHDIIFHQSKEMLAFWQETLLINVYHLNPRLLSQWCGRNAYMGSLFPWDAEMNRLKSRPADRPPPSDDAPDDPANAADVTQRNPTLAFPGITVGHQALGMAIEMGFSEIVVSGLDLCFDKEGFTHTEGSEECKVGPFTAPSELWVETNGGWQAETRYDFLNAIPSLAFLAKFARSRQCRVINPAPGAAKIEFIDHLPWDTLTVVPMETPARERMQRAMPEETARTRTAHYDAVMQELLRVRGEVQTIARMVTEALDCNDRFFGRTGHPPDFKYKKRMDEIEKTLDETLTDMSKLVKRWGIGEFLKLSRPDKKKAWSDEEIEEAGRRYYEIYRESAGALVRLLDDIRQRLRFRMEEEKPKPNIKSLITHWQAQEIPGRLHLFLHRRQQTLDAFSGKVAVSLQALADDFQHTLEEKETNYTKHCFQSLATPQAIRLKILHLFKQKERDRLQAFADGLEKTVAVEATGEEGKSGSNTRTQYGLLIKGLLAELDGDKEEAMRAFRQVTAPVVHTDAILRLLTLALSQGELLFALPIAKRLADRSPMHIPYYGDLLRLTGQHEEALAVYAAYTKKAKNDLVTMLKWGVLQTKLGRKTEARQTFTAILKEDAHNKAAALYLSQLGPAPQESAEVNGA